MMIKLCRTEVKVRTNLNICLGSTDRLEIWHVWANKLMMYVITVDHMIVHTCSNVSHATLKTCIQKALLKIECLKHACFMHVSAHFMRPHPESFMHEMSSNNIE